MGLFGGSSPAPASYSYGGSPQTYIPTAQPQGDISFQNLLGFGQGVGGGIANPASQFPGVNPASQAYTTLTQNYGQFLPLIQSFALGPGGSAGPGTLPQAQAGAQTAADYFANSVFPAFSGAPGALAGATNAALGLQPTLTANATNPLYGSLTSAATTDPYYQMMVQGGLGGANIGAGTAGMAPGAVNQLFSGGSQILNTGFDPQQDLYNRLSQENLNNALAINAASGVNNTPYGAGLATDTMQNFQTNWQNQQLARQAAALQAGGGAFQSGLNLGGGAANLLNTSAGYPAASYMGALSGVLPFLSAASTGGLQGAGGLNALIGAGNTGFGGGLNIGSGLTSGVAGSSALPYNLGQTVGTNALQTLQGLQALQGGAAGIGGSAFALPQQVINDLLPYMQLGQAAQTQGLGGGQMGVSQLGQGIGGLIGGANALFNPNYGLFGGGGGGANAFGNFGDLTGAPGSELGAGALDAAGFPIETGVGSGIGGFLSNIPILGPIFGGLFGA